MEAFNSISKTTQVFCCFCALWLSMMVFNIIKFSITDLSYPPAAFISDFALLFYQFCVIFTNSYTCDMFHKNIPFWFSHVFFVFFFIAYIYFLLLFASTVNILCFLSILLNRLIRFLTISSPPSFNHSALHEYLLFFSLNIGFRTILSVILSNWIVFLIISWNLFFFNYPFTFIFWVSRL